MTTQRSSPAAAGAQTRYQDDPVSTGPASGPASAPAYGILDAVLEATGSGRTQPATATRLADFLREVSPWQALVRWLGVDFPYHEPDLKQRIIGRLSQDVARLDELLTQQLNSILHHPRLQQLEASWRGLNYLAEQVPEGENIRVRVLNVSWHELVRDLERALEFDQTQLFRKVYEDEFGTPGGEPFGVLLGDYEMHPRPGPGHPTNDLDALQAISGVAAAAFAPFVTGAHPSVFEIEEFAQLERPLDLAAVLEKPDYIKWRSLRDSEDARFVGLALPRVLMRQPYAEGSVPELGFRFEERVGRLDRKDYLWGNAAYAFGGVLIRNFGLSGWLGSIRGVKRNAQTGGLVTGLPAHSFGTDRAGVAPKCSTDLIVTDTLEKELGDLGFLPLSWCPDTHQSAFHGSQSFQKPQKFDELAATMNARLSAMLQYMFCVSRFAHYLKVIARDKIGGFHGPAECEDFMRKWLLTYTNANDNASDELKARHPLREGRVQIQEIPGKPGAYRCIMHLRPQFQLEQMAAAIRLVTTLGPGKPG